MKLFARLNKLSKPIILRNIGNFCSFWSIFVLDNILWVTLGDLKIKKWKEFENNWISIKYKKMWCAVVNQICKYYLSERGYLDSKFS